MSDIGKRQYWGKGQTAPAIEAEFSQEDITEAVNLYGYAVWLQFWYAGAVPHKVAPAAVTDPVNGSTLYTRDGAECPSAGSLLFQVEVMNPGSVNGQIEEWGTATSDPFRVTVLESEP